MKEYILKEAVMEILEEAFPKSDIFPFTFKSKIDSLPTTTTQYEIGKEYDFL
jgi:hypothetical protein